MGKPSRGPVYKGRAWCLIEALFLQAQAEAQGEEGPYHNIQIQRTNWRTSKPQLIVKNAPRAALSALIQKWKPVEHSVDGLDTLAGKIGEILTQSLGKDPLQIYENLNKSRIRGAGSEIRHFRLTLWSTDLAENKNHFEREWENSKLKIPDTSPIDHEDTAPLAAQAAYDEYWVGREEILKRLNAKVRGECRIVMLLGITGIGKTALAEKLSVELQDWFDRDWQNKFRRANFDHLNDTTLINFASVAARWFAEWQENLTPEEERPEKLLSKLVHYLRNHQVLILIDSLERLLAADEAGGWGSFADPWWEKFFVSILSAESCQSRLIITSQDLPIKLAYSRYQNFLHRQVLHGLDELDQIALFESTGLDVSQNSPDRTYLLRIAKAYQGHPLILRVILGEIWNEPFNGDVRAYWHDERENIEHKIQEVERALAEASQGKTVGDKDEWKLHTLTRQIREQVNKQYLEIAFQRLARDVKDAYILLCAASVYRAPERETYWLKHLVYSLAIFYQEECSKERQIKALEELSNRFFIEESLNHNGNRLLSQHHLVRSLAIEHRNHLEKIYNSRS